MKHSKQPRVLSSFQPSLSLTYIALGRGGSLKGNPDRIGNITQVWRAILKLVMLEKLPPTDAESLSVFLARMQDVTWRQVTLRL